ncbi:hypothetical protein RB594_005737 [Gaeumannomyces avenae]
MRVLGQLSCLLLAGGGWIGAAAHDITGSAQQQQHVLHDGGASRGPVDGASGGDGGGIPESLFSDLERLARLVDITYCVGTTGISPPFSCASRCGEFPGVQLVTAWNTGALLTDSCGYVAVDRTAEDGHGQQQAAPGAIVVAFRGTYSITNTVIDLSTVPQEYVPYPESPGDGDGDGDGEEEEDAASPRREKCSNCTVHMGFLASWRMARGLVLPAVREAKRSHPDYPVRLVGHSLGGALAALAALELRLVEGWDDVDVTTFGEPRVGNKGLADFIDKVFGLGGGGGHERYRRVTHAGDPVPLLPLSEWGYRAHAGEIYVGKPALPPYPEDVRLCRGAHDPACSDPAESSGSPSGVLERLARAIRGEGEARVPTRLKLWELFFSHRDYFWRLGLCVPGGDPADWGRDRYRFEPPSRQDEL